MTSGHKENSGLPARIAATQAIDLVLSAGKTLDDALDQAMGTKRMPEVDRKLVHAIAGTVFRHLPQIDAALMRVMAQKRDPKPSMLHNLLRVGIAQLLYMDVADHAAIDTAVSAAGSLRLIRQKSFINACLRSVQREKERLLAEPSMALEHFPEWLALAWIEHYGEDRAESIAAASLSQAPIDITLNAFKAPHEKDQLPQGEALAPWHIRSSDSGSHITSWPGFTCGKWWVQDLAASLPINTLGDIHDKSVLDVGAAPGGKTMQLASLGARVTALDVSGSRMQRVTQNLSRVPTPYKVQTVVADARKWKAPGTYDVIVLDAPCSSSGTLRRHPELPWIRSENEVMTLGVIQRELLDHAVKMLSDGGRLLYCTCSLLPSEGESQVEAFMERHKGFNEIRDVPESLKALVSPGINNIGFRTFPDTLKDKGGMDGFFFALLERQ